MKRTVMILVLCAVGAGLVACAAHGDRWLGEDSSAATFHGAGCGLPLTTVALATALSFLPLTGSPAPPAAFHRLSRRPVSFFQPPERSA